MDTVRPAIRSRMMSKIGGRDTAPELFVRSYLHATRLRFRTHAKDLPGRPDIVLPRYRTVVFVHGCFWHRHTNCRFTTTPATRPEFWQAKFAANKARDQKVVRELSATGWNVLIFWECEIANMERLDALFWRIVANEH